MKKQRKQKKQAGGIVDPMGQWKHPGKITTIPGNRITMQGVPYPVLGVSNTGDKKLMLPGKDYKFKGKSVTEYPMFQAGGRTPIYVNDPNDPRLKAYNDSLALYKKYPNGKYPVEDVFSTLKSVNNNIKNNVDSKLLYPNLDFANKNKIKPNKIEWAQTGYGNYTDEEFKKGNWVNYIVNGNSAYGVTRYFTYKKPVQPVKLVNQTLPNFTVITRPSQTTTPITPIKGSGTPGIKGSKIPMPKRDPGKPWFAVPSTVTADGKGKDVYSYDAATGKYQLVGTFSDKEASAMNLINKNSVASMEADLNKLNINSQSRNPYVQKKQLGGAIGTTIGTALNFIPGVGPMMSQIATPLLSALGQGIENKIEAKDPEKKVTAEKAFTSNPFGFQSGGSLGYIDVYNYLLTKGVSQNHAIGMLANIKAESGFNPAAIGDKGTSGGLFQHHNERFDALKKYAGEDWATNWQKQVDYALSENDTKKYLSQSFTTAEDASKWFTTNWERPANKEAKAAERIKYISEFDFSGAQYSQPVPVATQNLVNSPAYNVAAMPKYTNTSNALTLQKQGIAIKASGGKLPGKLLPLKQEGKFEPLGEGLFIAKGPSHAKGGIDADLAINGSMDGIPEINLEGGEIIDDRAGYIFRKKEISDKYLPIFKNLKDRSDQVSKNTRSHMRNMMLQKNEELLAKEGKQSMTKAQSGMDYTALAQYLTQEDAYSDNPLLPQQTVTPIAGFAQTPPAVPGIKPAMGNTMGGTGYSSFVPRVAASASTNSLGQKSGSPMLKNTPGDWAQLAGIAVPTIYNAIKAFQPAEEVKPVNNPYASRVKGLMANRSYNEQAAQNQITRAMNSGINQINNMTNSSSVRRANITNLIGNAEQQRAAANLQGQQMNNAYRGEEANMLNSLGGQEVQAKNLAQQINYANRGAKDAYGVAAVEGLGAGLTAFGQMRNANAYNNTALTIMNSAFPNYYWDTNTLNMVAAGNKPSWMSDADFQKAQAILYRK